MSGRKGHLMLGNEPVGMFSGPVDKIWHSHVLATHLYQQFCLSLHGTMIEHVPQVPPHYEGVGAICTTCRSCTNCSGGGQGGGSGAHIRGSAEEFYQAYTQAYNEPPPRHVWNLSEAEGLCYS